jgi:transposase
LATYKTDLVKSFLQQHSNVTLHFTPTYSSWLNKVESWFNKLQRTLLIAASLLHRRSETQEPALYATLSEGRETI